jgi:NADH dehydrogenase FAD-containing subunit
LVYAVGAETQTFGIKGVKEHACFMKELHDAEKVCMARNDFYAVIDPVGTVAKAVYGLLVPC